MASLSTAAAAKKAALSELRTIDDVIGHVKPPGGREDVKTPIGAFFKALGMDPEDELEDLVHIEESVVDETLSKLTIPIDASDDSALTGVTPKVSGKLKRVWTTACDVMILQRAEILPTPPPVDVHEKKAPSEVDKVSDEKWPEHVDEIPLESLVRALG